MLTLVVARLSRCDDQEKGTQQCSRQPFHFIWLDSSRPNCAASGGENSEKLAAARILAKDVLDSFTAMREYLREDGSGKRDIELRSLLGDLESYLFHLISCCFITYLPHKAVAEVSKDKEPIGRECAEFNWFESQLMSDSSEVRFK